MTGHQSRLFLVMALTVALAAGCSSDGEQLTVFAASSLTDVLADLAGAHGQAGGPGIVEVLGGSNHLAAQLRDGAPADVFVTADAALLAGLAIAGSPTPVTSNYLVVAVPADNPGGVTGSADLRRGDLRLAVCAVGVPCGNTTADRFGDLPADTEEPSVRAVLSRLVLGEADLGVVYATDVAAKREVVSPWPQEPLCPCVVYVAVALNGRGVSFVDFLVGPTAQNIFAIHGFSTP
ncbi:MAG: substrate-binding domain-containing protein [Actinomycetota bacterium]|nr:substrate-binding domain-containing protein [Actinomycetota bacterium]